MLDPFHGGLDVGYWMLDAGISQLVSNTQHPCRSEDYPRGGR
jgi:hypothetical protein